MAWNKYYIFVKSPALKNVSEILQKLNLNGYKKQEEVFLWQCNKSPNLFIGFYNENLLIANENLTFDFFDEDQSDTEKLFIDVFKGCEIAALSNNESSGCFGYAIIVNGKKIRMKDGCDGEIYNDFGSFLPEENDMMRQEIFMDEELQEMKENGMSGDEIQDLIKFEASYRVVGELTKRYLKENVNEMNPDKVRLMMYIKE